MGYDFSPSMFVYGPSKHWLAQRWWATHDRCKWPPSYGRSQSWLLFDGSIGTQYGFTDGGAWQSPHTGTPPFYATSILGKLEKMGADYQL